VANLTKPESSECSVDFSLGTITSSGLTELIQLTGSPSKLPDFEPLTINGSIGGSLISPEFIIKLRSGSGNIGLEGALVMTSEFYFPDLSSENCPASAIWIKQMARLILKEQDLSVTA
jgi:hypothetical protein